MLARAGSVPTSPQGARTEAASIAAQHPRALFWFYFANGTMMPSETHNLVAADGEATSGAEGVRESATVQR
jgi:hypothetical protein